MTEDKARVIKLEVRLESVKESVENMLGNEQRAHENAIAEIAKGEDVHYWRGIKIETEIVIRNLESLLGTINRQL